MPHQCTRCGEVYPDASKELLEGCSCGSRFFYYIKQEKFDEMKSELKQTMEELDKADKDQIERDIRELTGLDAEPDKPVILDLESVRVIKPGKFEIDIVNLFSKKRPLIYKLGEGKYIIDLASSLKVEKKGAGKKIKEPSGFLRVSIDEESDEEEKEEEESDEEEEIEEIDESEKEKDEEVGEEEEIKEESDEEEEIEESDEGEEEKDEDVKKGN